MNLADEELDALVWRLRAAWLRSPFDAEKAFGEMAREAARWAEEREGEVVWEYQTERGEWVETAFASRWESQGHPVRAIRVIATTTKGVG